MPTPAESLAEFVERFRSEAAQDLRVVYQLHLTGDWGGTWHLTIADQQCRLADGPASSPDVTVTMSADDWTELIAGRLDGFSAYLAGRIQIVGNLHLITRLQSLFAL